MHTIYILGIRLNDVADMVKSESVELIAAYGLRVLAACVLLVVGLVLIRWLTRLAEKSFERTKLDISLARFLKSALSMGLKGLLIITLVQFLKIPTASIIAVVGAAGLGIGFALQGSLSNLAGGILILVLRPFSVGDYIFDNSSGNEGTVNDIQVFYTTLLTKDRKTVIIPNGPLANTSIVNFSREAERRIDLDFGVAYDSDVALVKSTILNVMQQHPLVIRKDEVIVRMKEHADSAVIFSAFAFVERANFLAVKGDLVEQVKLAFDQAQIEIPYPHLDVKMRS